MSTSSARDPSRLAALVRAYLDADYRWTLHGDWHDLRLGLPAPGLELAHPDRQTFGFLSAWNPWSVERSAAENRAADATLQEALARSGLPFVAAFASAPNRSWREPSWVVMGMQQDDFDQLSRGYDQLGTLWWTSGRSVRLRIDAACPDDLRSQPLIDWIG